MDSKEQFRAICLEYLQAFRNLKLPLISKDLVNEAVFIDFRVLPHIELLLRNAILKLGNEWSFIVVCGNINYDFMSEICSSISPNIKIVRLDVNNLDINGYNNLLLTAEFWELFIGNKILLYQEDSYIFKDNISDFLKFDYIGAPWNHLKGYSIVGNGGFSLRNRMLMIEIIRRIPIDSVKLHPFLKMEMERKKMEKIPEDVYYSRVMLLYKVGRLADLKSACLFSVENLYYRDPFGGHQFWIAMKDWKNVLRKNIFMTIKRYLKK